MKKLFIVLLAACVFAVVDPTKSEAIVRYDGAEVYKDQTGKMTFTKDIKVYKKNEDGTFDSLVVKRNNYFRTYNIEKYDGKTFYQMGQYRVQATNLVVFKEVPMKIRSSFYPNPTYININRDSGGYGKMFTEWQDSSITDMNGNQMLKYCKSDEEGLKCEKYYPGSDMKVADTKYRKTGVRYEVTEDTKAKSYPLIDSKTEKVIEKGSIVYSVSDSINAYLCVKDDLEANNEQCIWLPVGILKPIY